MPKSTCSSFALDNFPTRLVSEALSRVTICDTLATESWESRHSRLKKHVAWSVGPAQRAGQRHAHDRIDPTAVERVTLYDNDWSSESGCRP